jgi:hypothetical protein
MTEKTYTETEALHLVAREVAKQRMGDMEAKIAENDSKTATAMTELKLRIEGLHNLIEKQNLERVKTADSLREEIEKDFASKTDLMILQNKVDQLWLRISVSIGTVIAVGMVLQYIVFMADKTKGLL